MFLEQSKVMREPFNLEVHKKTFTNYLEVLIDPEGTVHYAMPSHQEFLINAACEKLGIDRDELNRICPPIYYGDFMFWLCKITGYISVWNEFSEGNPNEKQAAKLVLLSENEIYQGVIRSSYREQIYEYLKAKKEKESK